MTAVRLGRGFDHLLSPFTVGPMTVRNRIVAAPMERNYAHADGTVSERTLAHYDVIAAGGVGWIDLEATFVDPAGRGAPFQVGIFGDEHVPGLRRLVDLVHGHGAAIGIELHHAGRNTNARLSGHPAIAASPVPGPASDGVPPREMDADDIAHVVAAFAAAAARAEEAGFDAVEIHSAHGYLPLSFLSPFYNRRTDGYGGGLQQRLRFHREVLRAIRDAVGHRVAVGMRLSIDEFIEGGLQPEEAASAVADLERADLLDFVHLSAGTYETAFAIAPAMHEQYGYLLERARVVRQATTLPVIVVNRLSFDLAETGIEQGDFDFAAFGRQFLTDPAFPAKLADKPETIVHCIGCNQGCIDQRDRNLDSTCILNPIAGRELEPEFRVGQAETTRHVVVVGGGPAGTEVARVAAERGHRVTLIERSPELGGQVRAAATPPFRAGWRTFLAQLPDRLARAGVTVMLDTTATPQLLAELEPDDVVLATGARFAAPVTAGAPAGGLIVDAVSYLAEPPDGDAGRVIVLGAGKIGLAAAEHALATGHEVVLVDERPTFDVDAGFLPAFEKAALRRLHADPRVTLVADANLWRVDDRTVVTKKSAAAGPLFAQEFAEVTRVVMTTGRVPLETAWETAVPTAEAGARVRVQRVGDCVQPSGVGEAILDGARLAARL